MWVWRPCQTESPLAIMLTNWEPQNYGNDRPSMSWLQGVGWCRGVRKHLTGEASLSNWLTWGQLRVTLPLRYSGT